MFKGKNKVTRISNGFLITLFIMALFSSIVLIKGLITGDPGSIIAGEYTKSEYLNDTIIMIAYVITTGIALLLLNRKINLYKDEYSTSRQVFNLLFALSIVSLVIMFATTITNYFIFNKFSLYSILSIFIVYIPVYIYSYYYVDKKDFLSKENTKKINIFNFFVVELFILYLTNFGLSLLELILKTNEFLTSIQNIGISLLWMGVILLAYKIMNRKSNKNKA